MWCHLYTCGMHSIDVICNLPKPKLKDLVTKTALMKRIWAPIAPIWYVKAMRSQTPFCLFCRSGFFVVLVFVTTCDTTLLVQIFKPRSRVFILTTVSIAALSVAQISGKLAFTTFWLTSLYNGKQWHQWQPENRKRQLRNTILSVLTFGFALQGPAPLMKQAFSNVAVGVLFIKSYYFHEVSLTTFWLHDLPMYIGKDVQPIKKSYRFCQCYFLYK